MKLYTTEQAGKASGFCVQSLSVMVRAGVLVPYKKGRVGRNGSAQFTAAQVKELIRRRKLMEELKTQRITP